MMDAPLLITPRRGAVAMAKAGLLCGANPVLRQLAQEMIAIHQREIRILK